MKRHKAILLGLMMTLVVLLAGTARGEESRRKPRVPKSSSQAREAAARVEPVLEPRAIDLLKGMGARLAAAKSLTFTALGTYESPSLPGPALVYTTVSEVTLQRPDKLRVITPGDGPASEFYYDGKTMMAYAPAENLVAVANAPPTIDAALKEAFESAAIYFPFADVVVADPYKDIAEGLKLAFVIGQSHVVGGATTDIVAIANDKVFAQIWIGAEDKLPRMIRAVYLDDPSRLRHQVEFSNWHIDTPVASDAFASSRAAGASHIQFARPDPKLPPGTAPTAKSKTSKPKKTS
jgi:hypothetical protein